MTCLRHIKEKLRKKQLTEQEEETVKQALQQNHPEWLDPNIHLQFDMGKIYEHLKIVHPELFEEKNIDSS